MINRRRPRRCARNLVLFVITVAAIVYFNIQYNWPVFHVFRNKNVLAPCILPKFDVYDPQLDRFFWSQVPLKCETWENLVFIDSNGMLRINQTAITRSGHGHVSCKYGKIQLHGDHKVSIGDLKEFKEPEYINTDFINVQCINDDQEQIYNNLHMHVDIKSIKKQREIGTENMDQLSVYLFGIDSMSRLITERKMDKTMEYLREELGAYVLKGYTKVGDNTYPNLLSLLTGLKAYTKEVPPGLDNVPFIWKNFSRKGYIDLLSEDHPGLAAFQGFQTSPATHYLRPYFMAMEKIVSPRSALNNAYMFVQHRNFLQNNISPMCFGNQLKHKYVMDYTLRFVETYGSHLKFAFTWINEITHDFINIVELADEDVLEHFRWLKESKRLENAVLIFFSDHGPRYSEMQNTAVGRISNLLPLFAMVLPDHIKSRFPHIHRNLKTNINRLSTHYDVFETLKDIMNADFTEKPSIDTLNIPRGISLLREIPTERSCKNADISEHYCPCYSSKGLSAQDERVRTVAQFVVDRINTILQEIPGRCAKLSLGTIEQASLVYADMERDADAESYFSFRSYLWKIEEKTRILVTLKTSPGGAKFETTVEYRARKNIKLLGDINRTNKYGDQAKCIKYHEKFYRLYCLCL
ncbi:uncharacterized protein LOC125667748 [Ostrea edulis]|uniref:uncharacterized protein LOC125667748 n=1 Tax=Ostrea edulis TaxID=37623 RepID=UPI0024AEF0F9|nr:uncharacterized protein LOC125667748 [Ostrea edulis]